MIKNALVITNRVRKIPGGLVECVILPLQKLGYKVFWAADFSIAKFDCLNVPCEIIRTNSRSLPFNPKNISTYLTIKKTIKDYNISLVFCHTPIGGFLGRLAAYNLNVPCVIYEAHGFLFFKNGPKLGWLYKIIEQKLAHFTNFLITINEEDFNNANKFELRENGCCYMVHGAGMNLDFNVISNEEKEKIKSNFAINNNVRILISIGELNSNKNVKTLIQALSLIKSNDWILLICGEGPQEKKLKNLVKKKHLMDKVKFLGYRNDINDLLNISDLYISCSKREGLSRTVSEAMALKTLCVVSDRRGMNDLIEDKIGGFLFEPYDYLRLATLIDACLSLGDSEKEKLLLYSQEKIRNYTADIVSKEYFEILTDADLYLKRTMYDNNKKNNF